MYPKVRTNRKGTFQKTCLSHTSRVLRGRRHTPTLYARLLISQGSEHDRRYPDAKTVIRALRHARSHAHSLSRPCLTPRNTDDIPSTRCGYTKKTFLFTCDRSPPTIIVRLCPYCYVKTRLFICDRSPPIIIIVHLPPVSQLAHEPRSNLLRRGLLFTSRSCIAAVPHPRRFQWLRWPWRWQWQWPRLSAQQVRDEPL